MTNKEAVIAECKPFTVDDAMVEKSLIDNGVDGTTTYASANRPDVAAVAYDVLKGMASLSSVSEGGFSMSFKAEQLKEKLVTIAHVSSNPKHLEEVETEKPVIRDASNRW